MIEKLAQVSLKDEYPFGGISSLAELIGFLVPVAFSIAGTAVLIYFIYGAFNLVFSGGDKTKVQSARDMITHAIIGIILLVMMFLILQFVSEYFGIDVDVIEWR